MNIYRFGAVLNIVAILLLGVAFALMHVVDSFYTLVMENIFDPLNVSKNIVDDLLFIDNYSTINMLKPIAISVGLIVMFFLVGVYPLVKIKHLIRSGSKVKLLYFVFAMLLSLGFGGGLFMLIGLVGLRSGIYVKQSQLLDNQYQYVQEDDRTFDILDQNSYVAADGDYVNESDEQYSQGLFHKRGAQDASVMELKKRIRDLKRHNVRMEENAYFTERRQNRRIENLEMDLASTRRRNRR